MGAVKHKNTKPEIEVRSILHRLGYRFRLHRKDLPGKPDIVLPRYKAVIFVNGCFWHRHPKCRYASMPATNTAFWEEKFEANIQRDKKNVKDLKKQGWQPLVVWQCELKNKDKLRPKLKSFLERI